MDRLGPTLQQFFADVQDSDLGPDLERKLTFETEEALFDVLLRNVNIANDILAETQGRPLVAVAKEESFDMPEPVWDKVPESKFSKFTAPKPKPQQKEPQRKNFKEFAESDPSPASAAPAFGRRAEGGSNQSSPSSRNQSQPSPKTSFGRMSVSHFDYGESANAAAAAPKKVVEVNRDPRHRAMKAPGVRAVMPATFNPVSGHYTTTVKVDSPSGDVNARKETLDNRRRGKDWGNAELDTNPPPRFGRKAAPRNSQPGGRNGLEFNSINHEQAVRQTTGIQMRENHSDYQSFKARNYSSNVF